METLTQSERQRKKGNEYFAQSQREGLAPSVKKSRLQEAILHYNRALSSAANGDQRASALKNLAKVNWQVTKTYNNEGKSSKEEKYYFNDALKCYFRALQFGQHCKSPSWLDDVKMSQSSCLTDAWESVCMCPLQERLGSLETFTQHLQNDHLMAECFFKIGSLLFQNAVITLEKADYKTSLCSLKECYRPIEEMRRLAKNDPLLQSEANVLTDDIDLHTASAQSMQAVATGDGLLRVVLHNQENLNMSMLMDVIDWYTKAVLLARGVELEREAIACSRLGNVFDRVLKIQYRAKKYYKHCLELALSMTPRVVAGEEWYRVAADTLEKYQRESLVEQEQRDAENKTKYKKEYAKQLAELDRIHKTYEGKNGEILFRIYKAFPPKKQAHTLPKGINFKTADEAVLKKLFLNACIHYHPDKQDVSKYGEGWKVFCEEVTKVFSSIYAGYKGL